MKGFATTLAAAAVTAAGAASAQDVVRIASASPVTTLDPIASAAAGSIEAFGQLYARLLRKDAEGELQPGLAESWELSEDGLRYTFELRDAQFSDGTPITAEDVAFSLNRVATDEASTYPAPFSALEEARAVDEDTVEIALKHRSAPMLTNLEVFNAAIVSKDDVEERGEEAFAGDPVTSGPFTVEDWRPNDRLVLTANPNYWREGYPKAAGAELIEVSDDNARVSMILAGEVDAVRGVPWAQIAQVDAAEGVSVPLEPSTVLYTILPNHARPPFEDPDMRRAAAMAIDREAVTNAITLGHAETANSTLSSALDFHDAGVGVVEHDPEAARAILEEADAVGTEITMIVTPANAQMATLLQAQWDATGFRTIVERVDTGLWWDRILSGDYDAAPSWYYNETEDPDLAVRFALCGTCGNDAFYTNYGNEEVDALIDEALREPDEARRAELYARIQEITVGELANIPLYYSPFSNAYSDRISGLTLSPSLQWSLEETAITE